MIWSGWEQAFLQAIGAPVTPQNVSFLDAWAQREEPYSSNPNAGYSYNPLNTTYPGGPVQNYGGVSDAITAFANTITQNPAYQDLLNALRGGNPSTTTNYNGLALWSGGGGLNASGGTQTGKGYANLAGISGSSSSAETSPIPGAGPCPGFGTVASILRPDCASSWNPNAQNWGGIGTGAPSWLSELASTGVVLVSALTLLLIGGIWLVMGNTQARTIVTTVGKGAAKAASLAA